MFTPNEMMLIFVVIVCVWAVMLFFIERLQQRFFEQELDALSDDQKTLSSESRSEALLMRTKEAVSKNPEVRFGHKERHE